MANFVAYHSIHMAYLGYEHLRPADFQSIDDPRVTYEDTRVTYKYYTEPEVKSFRFDGDFDFVFNGTDVVGVSGQVTEFEFRWPYVFPDIGVDYLEGFIISDINISVSSFQQLKDLALSRLIFSGDDDIEGTALDQEGEGNGQDVLIGFGGDDVIRGLSGDDFLYGGVGNDQLDGGYGSDVLDGGDGYDTAVYSSLQSGVAISLAEPSAYLISIENLTGTNFNDTLGGSDIGNVLNGGGGNDTANGDAGNDKLFGSFGDDMLIGGQGADYLSGGAGSDTASYATAGARVVVQLLTPGSNEGDAIGDIFNSIENIVGSNFDDGLVGTAGANRLDGGMGIDRVFGIEGNDTLLGGEGADYLSGGLGNDTASYADATAGVIVSLANPAINSGEAKGDTFNSIENLIGSNYDDYANGNDARNAIDGGSGSDIIRAYAGNDILTGGAGQDTFVFNSAFNALTNVDAIVDFNVADDRIEIDNAFFLGLATGALAAGAFKDVTVSAKDANDRILYNSDTGGLFYDRDGSGGTYAAIKFAALTGSPTLTAADFVVI